MKNILDDIDSLLLEVSALQIGGIGTLIAAALGLTLLIGPAIFSIAFAILQYPLGFLLNCVLIGLIAGGTSALSVEIFNKLKDLKDLDKDLDLLFNQLSASGYENIDIIKTKSLQARDAALKVCNDTYEDPEGHILLRPECAKKSLLAYMETCGSLLLSRYIELLSRKNIRIHPSANLEYILSNQEEFIFNQVTSKIIYKFTDICDTIFHDSDEFKTKIVELAKGQVKVNMNANPPRSFQPNQPKKQFPPQYKTQTRR